MNHSYPRQFSEDRHSNTQLGSQFPGERSGRPFSGPGHSSYANQSSRDFAPTGISSGSQGHGSSQFRHSELHAISSKGNSLSGHLPSSRAIKYEDPPLGRCASSDSSLLRNLSQGTAGLEGLSSQNFSLGDTSQGSISEVSPVGQTTTDGNQFQRPPTRDNNILDSRIRDSHVLPKEASLKDIHLGRNSSGNFQSDRNALAGRELSQFLSTDSRSGISHPRGSLPENVSSGKTIPGKNMVTVPHLSFSQMPHPLPPPSFNPLNPPGFSYPQNTSVSTVPGNSSASVNISSTSSVHPAQYNFMSPSLIPPPHRQVLPSPTSQQQQGPPPFPALQAQHFPPPFTPFIGHNRFYSPSGPFIQQPPLPGIHLPPPSSHDFSSKHPDDVRQSLLQVPPPVSVPPPLLPNRQPSLAPFPFSAMPNLHAPPPQSAHVSQPFSSVPSAENMPLVNAEFHMQQNPSEVDDEGKSEQAWLQKWAKQRHILEKPETSLSNQKSAMKIVDVQCSLKRLVELLSQLKSQKQTLQNSLDAEDAIWHQGKQAVDSIKQEFESKINLFTDSTVQSLTKKIDSRAAKRARLKMKKKLCWEAKQLQQQERNKIDAELDKWQASIVQKNLEMKQEVELKKAADSTLSEVRRKLNEATRTMELFVGLQKLRKIRKEKGEQHGKMVANAYSHDKEFDEKMTKLQNLMKLQLSVYKREERTLQVMLEVEQEETKEKERELKRISEIRQATEQNKLFLERIFGKEEKLAPDDELKPFQQYYGQALHSLDACIQIRHDWDLFLVPEGTPGSSAIPETWVLPDKPSNDAWEKFLVQ